MDIHAEKYSIKGRTKVKCSETQQQGHKKGKQAFATGREVKRFGSRGVIEQEREERGGFAESSLPVTMAPTPRRGTGGGGSGGAKAAPTIKSWAQIAVALCVVALPWCISHASGGAGKAAIDRLSRDGYTFGSGSGVAVRLSAKPSSGGGGGGGSGGGGMGPPLRGGGSGSSGGGGGGGGGGGTSTVGGGLPGGASSQATQTSSSGVFAAVAATARMGKGRVWKGEKLNFAGPDNVDEENGIDFAPPPPPDSPKHALSYAQMKHAVGGRGKLRCKLNAVDHIACKRLVWFQPFEPTK
jgi:hypothetical protein